MLKTYHKLGWLLLWPAVALCQAATPPDADVQAATIEKAREFAATYTDRIPNFLCTDTTVHFEGGGKADHWSKGDRVVAQLAFVDNKEHHTVQSVNNKPVTKPVNSMKWHLLTEGDFALTLQNVLSPASEAKFEWKRYDTVRNHQASVFDFSIDRQHSGYRLSSFGVAAIVPWHGTFWADPASGEIWRIDYAASEVPPELDVRATRTVIDYDNVSVGNGAYILPVHSVAVVIHRRTADKNESDYSGYRKFTADSSISFGDPDVGPPKP